MKIDENTEVAIAKDGMWVELKPEDIGSAGTWE
jgi:hypothetical protein